MKQLILIDGNAILHRAFHALPDLTSPNGDLVNAVYGFFSMFLRVLEDIKPEYAIVCFDRPKPTFRKALYVGYQAHRPAMADDLSPQIALVHELLKKMRVPIFEVDGYEADDVIGTLAFQAVSNTKPRGTETRNQAEIVDYKALVGDASDGYPGVTGIGPKTASYLIKDYETFENLYQNVDKLPIKISEKLATDAEQAALAKKLATIVLDVPVKLVLSDCALEKFDMIGLRDSFEAFGFQSLIKRITVQVKKQEEVQKEKTGKQLGLL